MKEISQQDNSHSNQDMFGKKRQPNQVANTSAKQYGKKDNEHMLKNQVTVTEGDVSMVESNVQGEPIFTASFSSTLTNHEEGTCRQQ